MEGMVAIFVIAGFGFIAAVFIYACAVSVYFALWISVKLFRVAQWAVADRSGKFSEWQSIKTAPKDGTEFLAWVPNGYVILLYAFDIEAFVEQETGDKIETATHWMPYRSLLIGARNDALAKHSAGDCPGSWHAGNAGVVWCVQNA